ncbi:uncharacterized protein LOC143229469 [Tachypleus tridentatus]|uniref:uncharacterized protein LOC143229469 n=1 Tax=Tachypleus tridentatus TaxID=6853 RepID=UPI003FD13BF6
MVPAPTPVHGPAPSPAQALNATSVEPQMFVNPRDSMSIGYYKGLLNMPGQNNCFLNSAVQVLWHLDIFRRSFRNLNGHVCMADSCIFCALKELFTQFQYSHESALPPDALRRALAETFHQRRFQLGVMDDASECFENILRQIHFHIAPHESEDMCNVPHCIPHQKFAMTLVEQTICHSCGATSEPLSFTQMVHYVSTSALRSQATVMVNQQRETADFFGQLLKNAAGMGDTRECPGACGTKIQICRILMNHPEIVSVGLVWDSERPTLDNILEVFHSIGMVLKLQDMFHSVVDSQWAAVTKHQLVGIVTYYGKHYSTFFFHTKLQIWIYFDDATVLEIGPKWEQVIEKCRRGHFQPLLLLYANPNGSPVSNSTAPKSVMMVGRNHKSVEVSDNSHSTQTTLKSGVMFYDSDSYQKKTIPQQTFHDNYGINDTQNECIVKKNVPFGNGIKSNLSYQDYCELHPTWNSVEPGHILAGQVQHQLHHFCPSFGNSDSNVKCCSDMCPSNTPVRHDCSHQYNDQWNCVHPQSYNNTVSQPWFSAPAASFLHNTDNDIICSDLNSKSIICDPSHLSQNFHQQHTDDYSHVITEVSLNSKTVSQQLNGLESTKNTNENAIDYKTYINRKAVESVLAAQKLQRKKSLNGNYHTSIGNRNSSSSLESYDNNLPSKSKPITSVSNLTPDVNNTACVLQRRDSGNWSSDRNSASSASNTSLDCPYFYVVGNKKPSANTSGHKIIQDGLKYRQHDYTNVGMYSDKGYDSFSLSSTDSYPSITSPAAKLDLRLDQIPEDLQTVFQLTGIVKPPVEECQGLMENNSCKFKGNNCDILCAEADFLLTKSHEKENEGDLVMAAMLSDSAAAKARAAMDAPYNNSQSLVSAKMKHSFCVMRSSSLHKRLKEAEMEERRRQKEASSLEGHHSRQSSRDSTHGRHSRQGSRDGSSGSHSRQGSKDGSSGSHSRQGSKDSSSGKQFMTDFDSKAGKTIEIYATLPKKGSKRKNHNNNLVGSPKNKEEINVYGDLVDKQKQTNKPEVSFPRPDQLKAVNGHKHRAKSKDSSSKSGSERKKNSQLEKYPEQSLQIENKPGATEHTLIPMGSEICNYSNEWNHHKNNIFHRTWSGYPFSKMETSDKHEDIVIQTNDQCNKKQHKVRKKLMGGFMRRKNRSLPDLREGQNQSDSVSHSFDDCVIVQTPISSKSLDNKMVKNIDNRSDVQTNHMLRGFHQPHRAFIKNNIQQQRPLVKVNPPHVGEVVSHPACDLTNNHTQDDSEFPPPPPDHMLLIHSPDALTHVDYNWEAQHIEPPLPPLPTELDILPASLSTGKHGETTELYPQPLGNEFPQSSCEAQAMKLQEETSAIPNTFLAEIKAKRDKILLKASSTENHAERTVDNLVRNVDGMKDFRDHLTLGASQTGNTWLHELQNKQFQILHKRNKVFERVPTVVSETSSPGSPEAPNQKQIQSEVENNGQSIHMVSDGSQSTSLNKGSAIVVPVPKHESNKNHDEADERRPHSVKDLTSRFESILKPQKSNEIISVNVITSNILPNKCFESKKSETLVNDIFLKPDVIDQATSEESRGQNCIRNAINNSNIQNLKRLVIHADPSDVTLLFPSSHPDNLHSVISEKIKDGSLYQIESNPSLNKLRDSHHSKEMLQINSLSSESKRPECPPDYETAIQRIGLLKDRTQPQIDDISQNGTNAVSEDNSFHTRSPNEIRQSLTTLSVNEQQCNTVNNKLRESSIQEPKISSPLRKKNSPKKSVTFSEQVVLVACAEDNENEYLPNPLLERVYKQHLQEESEKSVSGTCASNPVETTSVLHAFPGSNVPTVSGSSVQKPCDLCHQKTVFQSQVYCSDCSFYMSKFKPRQ